MTGSAASRRNAHLTYQGNTGVGRHGWLRLTPAYSVRLVRDHVARLAPGSVVTDPFSGTGTTALAAVEQGLSAQALDINPFLVWLGRAKTRHYPADSCHRAAALADAACRAATAGLTGRRAGRVPAGVRLPPLANIERWWAPGPLHALALLRTRLDEIEPGGERDLLDLAFCRALIETSNAAFDHQSMSFRPDAEPRHHPERVVELFAAHATEILASAAVGLPGDATIINADSRDMDAPALAPCDLLFTSPPYVNRMSYIRELRPYMYWLRHLDAPGEAADLDWSAVGGTWGTATSRLATWQSTEDLPIEEQLRPVCHRIAQDRGRSGPLLATYVRRYFTDIWSHLQAAYKHVKSGGKATYIVGNSTFYGHVVPAQDWYRRLLLEAGFAAVRVETIRKRNSKKELFEFDVTAHKP